MAHWTVLLKVPDGIKAEVIEADSAEESDDGKTIEFANVSPMVDLLKVWSNLEDSATPKSPQQVEELFREFLKLAGQIHVGTFQKEEVVGYHQGLQLDITIQAKPRR